MNIKGKVCYCLYNVIGCRLPHSNSHIKVGQSTVRRYLAKGFVKQVGENVNIEDHAIISSDLVIGNNSGIGPNCRIMPKVTIGDNVMMGRNCFICTQNHEFGDIERPIREQGFSEFRPVTIGDDVWIGHGVIILPGVSIGRGSIVGAGAVVTESFPPYSIIGGNPAKLIRSRI